MKRGTEFVLGARWRERLWIWLTPLLFVAVVVAGLLTYRVLYAGRLEGAEQRLTVRRADLEKASADRQRLEELLARAAENDAKVEELYQDRFARESERLTRLIAEVKRLAERAGMKPEVITYPEQELAEYGLVKKSILFGVEGTYTELRRLINFLELSEQFVVLEQVSVSDSSRQQGRLRIRLILSSLFNDEPEDSGLPRAGSAGDRREEPAEDAAETPVGVRAPAPASPGGPTPPRPVRTR